MCIFQPFTVELRSCSYATRSTVIGFRKRCFVLVHSEVCCGSVRFGSLNTLLTLPLEKDCVGGGGEISRSRGETGDNFY